MIDRKFCLRVVFATAVCALPMTASASDYSHTCRSSDGQFLIDDGQLSDARGQRPNIPYRVLRKTTISHSRGYCLSNNRSSGGRRYGHEAKSYVMRIRFPYIGQQLEIDALCELVSDGLPAAFNCDRRVVLFNRGSGGNSGGQTGGGSNGSSGGGATAWNHNGSVMRLIASGKSRRFVYDRPRSGLGSIGVTSGTLLFDGQRDGPSYSGTARIFNSRCGTLTYRVAGEVSNSERRVTMYGQAPRVDSNCNVSSYRTDKLVFDLME